MRKSTCRIFLGIIAWTFFALPLQAEEKSAIDKLQSEARTESIHSTRLFLTQIDGLELDVKQRLMRARFTNTTQHFDVDDSLKMKTEGFVSVSSLTTGKDMWSLKFRMNDITHRDPPPWIRVYTSNDIQYENNHFEFIVNITPSPDMLEWMRARDELTEYSKQKIKDEQLTLNVFGLISSFTLEKTDKITPIRYTGKCFQRNSDYNTLVEMDQKDCTYFLISEKTNTISMNLKPYTAEVFICGDLRWGGFRGSLSDHTKRLRAKIAEWVKFYMGKGKEPN